MKNDRLIIILLLVLSFLYLIMQVFPSVRVGDSGELIAAAKVLGNAHPPGYPLFSLLGKLTFIFPSGNPAHRINSFQAVFASISVVLVFLIIKYSKINMVNIKLAAVFGGLLLLCGPWFIEQAVTAEVFMLNVFIAALVILAALSGKSACAGFVCGLGLGNQHTLILTFPAVLFLLLTCGGSPVKKISRFLICLSLGLTVYIYLPVRASGDAALNWGDPSGISRFLNVLLRRDYGTFSLHRGSSGFSISKSLMITEYFFSKLVNAVTPGGLAIFLAGIYMYLRNCRRFALTIILFFIFTGPVFFIMTNINLDSAGKSILERFFLLPYLAFSIACSGVFLIRNKLVFTVFILPLYLLISSYEPSSSKETPLYNYLLDLEKTISQGDSLYIMKGGVGDDIVFGMIYMQLAEERFTDLKIFSEYGNVFSRPVSVKGKAAFAVFSPGGKQGLYQTGLLFKNYRDNISFDVYKPAINTDNLDFRQRNIVVNYPFFRGIMHINKGEIQKGIKELMNAERIGSDIPWLMNNIGNIYLNMNAFEKALEYYEKALILNPELAESLNNIANIHYKSDNWPKAIEYYKRAIAIAPDAVRYYNLGLTYLELKQYDRAIENFMSSLEEDSGYAPSYNNIGLTYYRTKRYEEAIMMYEKALVYDPRNPDVYFNAALAYEKIDSREADKYWMEYLNEAPQEDKDRETAKWYLEN